MACARAPLMHRAFGLDVLRCPRCAGRMQPMRTIDDPVVIVFDRGGLARRRL